MTTIEIGGRRIGRNEPVFVIAELSGNHNGDLGRAKAIIDAAAEQGADAVKLQTYRPDTLTIDSDEPWFVVGEGSPWGGRRLYDLYREAHTPWEWLPVLVDHARAVGVQVFSAPFDRSAVLLHEKLGLPANKIASFELVDLELIEAAAATGRPLVLSTGMASADEIDDALTTARQAGAGGIGLLHCNSAYPAPSGEMNLRTIADMADRWRVPIGLSDHTIGTSAAVAAVALGACMVEKHICLARADGGPDASFSVEPHELGALVAALRETHDALGDVRYGPTPSEERSLVFRRSIFVIRDVAGGEPLTRDNVAVIRPGHGLLPKYLPDVLGRRAATTIRRGTPLTWNHVVEPGSPTGQPHVEARDRPRGAEQNH